MTERLRIGEVVGGHYRLVELLGEGGQSLVYRAIDLTRHSPVAVKVVKERIAEDPIARERMSREARALMNLHRTPAALRLYGQYWTEDGQIVLVTELLEGVDLTEYLEKMGGKLPLGELRALFPPVIETLEAAHRQGVVHRDLKPSNLFCTQEPPFIRLLDFGYAKFMRLRSFTEAGTVAGSPKYIPPEAWLGHQDLDPRADVYSMGALIFRCLSGRAPFESDSLQGMLELVTRAPRPSLKERCPELPETIDDWSCLALAIDRESRFQNIRALWSAFISASSPSA